LRRGGVTRIVEDRHVDCFAFYFRQSVHLNSRSMQTPEKPRDDG
jgi:hypothetical protein